MPQVVSLLPNKSNSSIYKVSVSNFAKSGQYKIRLTANCGSYLCTQELKLIIDRIGSLRADLIISPKIIEVNQTISIEVKTYDENNSPIKDASARGWVLKPNGEKEDLILSHYPSAAKFLGKFSGTMLVGIYKVVVEISRLLYDPYIVSETFTVQTFAYTQNVYAIEDYDYELTSNLTYPYYLGDVKSAKGTIYSIYVYCPFDDCVGLEVLKNGQLMWKGALYAGDLRFFDSGELLIYISEYLFSSITKSAILVIQFGTRTGRSSITPTLQRVEAGLTCEFNIEISAEDRCAAYVYGDIRDAVEFVGISWDIINDDKDLKRKEFCRFKPLPSSLTLRVNIPETIRLGDHYFWISILKSSISHLHDGMNPGDMFFVTLTVIPKLCSITLKSNSTMNYENLGSITFDGTPYKLYPSGCSTLKRAGTYIVKANPPHGFIFKYWICDGGITVKNSSACSTTATVTSDGTLIAVLSPSLGSIVGRITDSITKSEINSAEIHIYSVDIEFEGFIELFVETNESGSYTITNIPSCSYVVEVSHAEGYICGELDFSRQLQKIAVVFPNCTTVINFELNPLPQLKIEPQHKIIRQGESASFNLSIILHADPSWWWCLVDSFGVLNICLGDVPLPQGIICPSSIGQIVAPDDMVKLTINSTSTAKCGSHRILIIASCGGSFYIESYIMLEIVQSDVYINTIEFFDYSFDILIESNSSIVNFDFIHLNKTVYFETSGPKSTAGYCNVTLPKTFLEGPFTVLVNETEVTYLLKETDSKSFIYFTFNNNAIVRIAGSVLLEDSEPPTIILLHSPEEIITTPMENLKIYAHVIDYQTGLANVYLIYSINGGTSWSLPIEMNKISTHTYSAELPGFSEGTYITVRIFAIDHAGNVATSTSCQFEIIPEFSSKFFVLIFMILTTLISAIIIKITKTTISPNKKHI